MEDSRESVEAVVEEINKHKAEEAEGSGGCECVACKYASFTCLCMCAAVEVVMCLRECVTVCLYGLLVFV